MILISSMHHTAEIDDNQTPEIINFYNSTKGGVDALDQKCAVYSCQRRTRRWPMAVFGAILDISRVNAHVLLLSAMGESLTRRNFSIELGKVLIADHKRRRLDIPELSKNLKLIIRTLLGITANQNPEATGPVRIYKRCYLCPRQKDRKIKTVCKTCNRNVCKDHSEAFVCCQHCT